MKNSALVTIYLILALTACGGSSDNSSINNETKKLAPLVNAGNDQIADENSEVLLLGTASDSDGTLVSYSWVQISGTAVTLTSVNSNNSSFSAPKVTSDEVLTFQLTVTDNDGLTAKDSVTVTIRNINQSPTAYGGGNRLVEELATVTLSGSGVDVDGSITHYSWSQTAGTLVSLIDADTASATFTAPEVTADETLSFQLTVTDNEGETSQDFVEVKVNKFFGKNIILRVVRVTEDWMAYSDIGGWTNAVKIGHKESASVKYYEAAIWEETASIHLYAFDNEFDMFYGYWDENIDEEQKIAYRESYRLLKFDGLPPSDDYEARSKFLKNSFIDIANYIVNQYPDADHHLMYSGHGGPGGRLFDTQLKFDDAALFLESWTLSLGHNLGVIDMGGPCNKGSIADLKNFCQYADYYVASDLPNGGYLYDDWTIEKYDETNPELQYHTLFSASSNLLEVLSKRIDLKRKDYEYSIGYMTVNKVQQANYLYSCSSFENFHEAYNEFIYGKNDYNIFNDLLEYLKKNDAPILLLDQFETLFYRSAHNKDFFEWEIESNGLLMDNSNQSANTSPAYGTLDLRVKYAYEFDRYKAEFFLDMFNVFNDQAVIREQDLKAGNGTYVFGEGIEWVQTRRLYLGARLSFQAKQNSLIDGVSI